MSAGSDTATPCSSSSEKVVSKAQQSALSSYAGSRGLGAPSRREESTETTTARTRSDWK